MSPTPVQKAPVMNSAELTAEKSNKIVATLAQAEDAEQILQLNKQEYGPTDVLVTPDDFSWRYEQNPAGQTFIPVVRNEHDGVVGCIWIVPLKFRIKGQNHLVATGTNLVIHANYRNTFAYTKLLRQFHRTLRKQNIPLHFSFISEDAYQQHQQHSPQTTWTVPLLVKPLNFSAFVKNYQDNGWQGHLIKYMGRFASIFFTSHQKRPLEKSIRVETVNRFDSNFDEFWGDLKDKYPLMAIRDHSFLTWRFTNTARRQYKVLVARSEKRILGYVVLRCSTIRDVKTGLILDFLTRDNSLGQKAGDYLLAETESYFREQDMAISIALMSSFATEYRHLRRAGYQYLPPKISPRPFRFAFFVHDKTQQALSSLSQKDWFITFADYESF